MTLARASWITAVVVSALAAILLGFSGYSGYAITVAAVGLAAAVNLLPSPLLRCFGAAAGSRMGAACEESDRDSR